MLRAQARCLLDWAARRHSSEWKMRSRGPLDLESVIFRVPWPRRLRSLPPGLRQGQDPRPRPRLRTNGELFRLSPCFFTLHFRSFLLLYLLIFSGFSPLFLCFVLSLVSLLFLSLVTPSFLPFGKTDFAALTEVESPDLPPARHNVCDVSFPSQ